MTEQLTPATAFTAEDLQTCLRVLGAVHTLPDDDDSYIAVRHATSRMFKEVKKYRRAMARQEVRDADRRTMELTATGAADRLDDETEGLPLVSSAAGATAASTSARAAATSARPTSPPSTPSTTTCAPTARGRAATAATPAPT